MLPRVVPCRGFHFIMEDAWMDNLIKLEKTDAYTHEQLVHGIIMKICTESNTSE